MRLFRDARRAALLTLSLLSACAAADPTRSAGGAAYTNNAGNYLAGRFALKQGDFDTAASDLLRVLATSPNDQELLIQTFVACLSAGRPEAIQLARRLPGNQVAELLLGNDAAKSGDWQDAVSRFRAIPRDGVMQLLQPLLLAWASQGGGDTDQALATLRPFFANPRFRSVVALHSGMIADLAGRTRDAAVFYQQAEAELANQSPRSALILASWRARSGQPAEAAQILIGMTANVPEAGIALPGLIESANRRPIARALDGMAEAYATFAAALRTPESSELATVMSRLALDVKPDSATARLLAAEIQTNARHYHAALRLLDDAARTNDPVAPLIRLRRAALLQRVERTDEAIREVERIGRDYPDSTLPDIELGDLLRMKQRFAEAIVAYDRVVARIRQPAPGDWVVFYSRGIAFERTGQWTRAEADFHRALELSPDQPSVLNYLGYAWADMGRNLAKARDMIQRAAARRPNDGAITDSLGWVMFRQGNFAEAAKLLERAVGLEPEDPTITDHLGDVYWATGRRIEAHYQWRRALTLKPTAADAAKIEAKIKAHPYGTVASGN
ncbi:MAG: tetratricopeptide repeat protein [Acetobacteraceae bacterium]|nr:tetratricopeptide repeat protein [Acetobacteraceae bacterium]